MGVTGSIFPIGLNELASISSLVKNMVDEEKIDKTVITPLSKLLSVAKEREAFWKDCKKISARNAFMMYHAWRNLRLIISKMITRFTEAEQHHENPTTANDSLRLLPSLLHTYTFLLELGERELSVDEHKRLYDQITILRNSAFHTGMLPLLEEEMKELDKKAMVVEFGKFARGIRFDKTTSKGNS